MQEANYELFRKKEENNDAAKGIDRLELSTREQVVWDKARADAIEYMRQLSLANWQSARGSRMLGLEPSSEVGKRYLEDAEHELGISTQEEALVYLESFENACLEGYPPRDN